MEQRYTENLRKRGNLCGIILTGIILTLVLKRSRLILEVEKMNMRIITDPEVCGGEPCIKGTRIPVHVILSHLAAGEDRQTLLKNFPSITHEDILACLEYASFVTTEKVVRL